MMLDRLRAGMRLLEWRSLALRVDACPFCGPSLLVRLTDDETGVRCLRCGASAVHLALGWVLRARRLDLARTDACEFSARGPLVAYLHRRCRSLATSEYFADCAPGSVRDGIRCEDLQRLSYADASFDLVTHTEVLEHVPDDARALAESHRVLRPGGWLLFSVPIHAGQATLERARLRYGAIEHLQPPSYHRDPLRGGEGILAFRDYGADLLQRLHAAGFATAMLQTASRPIPWIATPRRIVVAQK